ncbi:hypothetical protein C7389_10262 [Azoarcus indigens]|uniref:Uncharacterized protein n=1 Tax=Azoarcus indigens TaxID=29545 RepID=A0A4R6ED71_9RHOO|nr:hypothetical protein C7389_10262 [Azoarcus indigens]
MNLALTELLAGYSLQTKPATCAHHLDTFQPTEARFSPLSPRGRGRGRGGTALSQALTPWRAPLLPNPPPRGGREHAEPVARSIH